MNNNDNILEVNTSMNDTSTSFTDSPNFQEPKSGRIKNSLNEMLHTKGIISKIIGLVLLIIISATITFLNLSKKASKNNLANEITETTSTSEVDYNPFAEINFPQNASSETQSEAATVVSEYLEYNLENDRKSAISLLSPNVDPNAFRSTLTGAEDEVPLYGKEFAYKIYGTQIKDNGNVARVSVHISVDEQNYIYFFTLSLENNSWQLMNKEVYIPVVNRP